MESRTILDFLLRQARVPEYQFRLEWAVGTIAFWDNRSVQHYATHDYLPHRRTMERVTLKGDPVFGLVDETVPGGRAIRRCGAQRRRGRPPVHAQERLSGPGPFPARPSQPQSSTLRQTPESQAGRDRIPRAFHGRRQPPVCRAEETEPAVATELA